MFYRFSKAHSGTIVINEWLVHAIPKGRASRTLPRREPRAFIDTRTRLGTVHSHFPEMSFEIRACGFYYISYTDTHTRVRAHNSENCSLYVADSMNVSEVTILWIAPTGWINLVTPVTRACHTTFSAYYPATCCWHLENNLTLEYFLRIF